MIFPVDAIEDPSISRIVTLEYVEMEGDVERGNSIARKGSGWQDSNLRPSAPKADALTGLRYTPKQGRKDAEKARTIKSPIDQKKGCVRLYGCCIFVLLPIGNRCHRGTEHIRIAVKVKGEKGSAPRRVVTSRGISHLGPSSRQNPPVPIPPGHRSRYLRDFMASVVHHAEPDVPRGRMFPPR